MNRLLRLALPLAALLANTSLSAQEIAGRVLVAAGDVVIQRGAEKISARRGTEARTGDIFQVGDKSNVQIRLTDESIIALNSRSTFRLTEYAFEKREPTLRRAFFDLLKGGMRTVTGLIGRSNRENYAVRTPTATIGIRGTHYALRYCNNDCYEGGTASTRAEPIKVAAASGADIGPLTQAAVESGPLAPNGTYGGVTDGRIAVTNQTGETVFGADQYFHVASINLPAQQLIAPPGFLRDTLEGRASAKGKKSAASAQSGAQQKSRGAGGESASTVAPTGPGGGSGDIGVTGSTTSSTVSQVLQINPFVVTDSVVAGGRIGSIVPIVPVLGEGLILYRITSGVLSGVCSSGPPCDLEVAEIRVAINLQTQTVGLRINAIDLDPEVVPVRGAFNLATGLLSPGIPLVNNNGVLSFSGTLTSANGATLRCETCGFLNEPSELESLTVSGTVSGNTLNLTFTGVTVDDSGTFNVVLPSVPLTTTPVAAVAYPTYLSMFGNKVTQSSGLDNVVGSSGLVRYGWLAGGPQGSRGSATSAIVGSDASAGNLVWGKWTGPGAQIVDADYNSFPTTGGQRVDWIYGDPANVTAVSGLGTVTYTPVGWSLNNGNGSLNSASLTANFMTRQIDLNVNASTSPTVGNTFQWTGSTQYGVTTTRFQGSLSGTCNGGCGTNAPSSGGFAGFIAGSAGQGAGVSISGGTGTPGEGVTGVIGFKR